MLLDYKQPIDGILKTVIEDNTPVSFGRVGAGENFCLNGYEVIPRAFRFVAPEKLLINVGMHISTWDEYRLWYNLFIDAIKTVDYVGTCSGHQFVDKYWNGIAKYDGFLQTINDPDPWTRRLTGKKVLIVSPFKDTIEHQSRYFSRFNEGAKIDNLHVIRAPYSTRLGGGETICFYSHLIKMQEEILSVDFDVAILGCAGYSLILSEFIKRNKQRPAVLLGGAAQLIFGIKGGRWDTHELYNDSKWIRPFPHEVPKNFELIEGGAYW